MRWAIATMVGMVVVFGGGGQAWADTIGIITNNTYGIEGAASHIITNQGHSAAILSELSAPTLAGVDVLWALNQSSFAQLPELYSYQEELNDFVDAGGVFMYHDRYVRFASEILPGADGFDIRRQAVDSTGLRTKNINVLDNSTIVTNGNGPGGIIYDDTLDSSLGSSHGYAVSDSLPSSSMQIFCRIDPLTLQSDESKIVDFSYAVGSGDVYYSTIPLDYYLQFSGPFSDVYAPNVVAYVIPEPSSLTCMAVSFAMALTASWWRRRKSS